MMQKSIKVQVVDVNLVVFKLEWLKKWLVLVKKLEIFLVVFSLKPYEKSR